jgi:hypothetical protein
MATSLLCLPRTEPCSHRASPGISFSWNYARDAALAAVVGIGNAICVLDVAEKAIRIVQMPRGWSD